MHGHMNVKFFLFLYRICNFRIHSLSHTICVHAFYTKTGTLRCIL